MGFRYRAMIPYLDAQRHASEGTWLRSVATIAGHPRTWWLLANRVAAPHPSLWGAG